MRRLGFRMHRGFSCCCYFVCLELAVQTGARSPGKIGAARGPVHQQSLMVARVDRATQTEEQGRILWAKTDCRSGSMRRRGRRTRMCNPRSTAHERTRELLCVGGSVCARALDGSLLRAACGSAPRCLLIALAYACTAVGPAVGAATAAAGLGSVEWVSTLAGSAVAGAALSAVFTAALTACIAGTVDGWVTNRARSWDLGSSWAAASSEAMAPEMAGSLRRLVPKQSIKGLAKSLLAQPLDAVVAAAAALGSAPGSSCVLLCWPPALAVGRALCAAVLGSMVAALALEASRVSLRRSDRAEAAGGRVLVGATAGKAAGKAALKTLVAATAKAALKHHGLCGPVVAAACSTLLGITCRNWSVDVLRRRASNERREKAE